MIVFFKRYRMQVELRDLAVDAGALDPPAGFELVGWQDELIDLHAEAKFHSFRSELDANVFPCLGEAEGCERLMREITRRKGFVPEATWLLVYREAEDHPPQPVGTVQGIADNAEVGLIQNIGVIPSFRGRGLGSVIVNRALLGFREMGVRRVSLEVTAKNEGAVRLYERLGFRTETIVYKSVDVPALS